MLRSALFVGVLGLAVSLYLGGCSGGSEPKGDEMTHKESMEGHEGHDPGVADAAEADMAVCPVSGEMIQPGKGVTLEYKGKTYTFCCEKCPKKFQENPEKYLKN